MSVFSSRPALRWLVPAAAAVAVIGGGAAIGKFAAVAEPSLPERSAAQLLVDVQTARLDGLSGTVVQRADLGLPKLPALPAIGGQGGLSLASLISGSNTLRVWYNGPDQARVALMSTGGETDVIRNGRDVWIWESRGNTATHRRLPADAAAEIPESPADALPVSPQQAADMALAAINPSTEVTTGRNDRVAGRAAYALVLSPRDKDSLVGQIRIAIDAEEYVPLRFEIFPKGSDDAAFSVAFTQVSFQRPDPAQFRFNPPPGAKVTEETGDEAVPPGAVKELPPGAKKKLPPVAPGEKPRGAVVAPDEQESSTVIGKGWTSVLVGRVSDGPVEAEAGKAGKSGDEGAAAVLQFLGELEKVSGPWGTGKLLQGKLFSALLTDDGRVLVGAVSPERLYQVAADPAAALKK
jgi:outer membrane lipoprotein-sorting protein